MKRRKRDLVKYVSPFHVHDLPRDVAERLLKRDNRRYAILEAHGMLSDCEVRLGRPEIIPLEEVPK